MKNLNWQNGYEVRLGLTGNRTAVISQEIGNNQKLYDGKTFIALLSDGRRMRVKLVGSDYDLHGTGTGDMLIRPLFFLKKIQ